MGEVAGRETPAAYEAKRLEALLALGILDTPREERFDRITRTAVRLFGMPKSFLALVDETRAWVKASFGTDILEVPREASIGGLAIESDTPLVVPDTSAHPRFADHPLVVGPDRIRSLVANPLRTPDGYPVGALCVMDTEPHHFTEGELKALTDLCSLAEEELADIELTRLLKLNDEVQARVRAVIDATTEGILLIGWDGVMRYHNKRFLDLFGFSEEDIDGRPLASLNAFIDRVFADPLDFRRRMVDAAKQHDQVTRFHIKQHYPEVRDLEVYWAPVRDREGRDLGRLHAFRDVTRERELDRMKDEFVSLVSHELRTPLTSIKGYVDLLLDGDAGDVSEEQREFLDIVKSNSDRLVMLVNDLLDVSRIEAGRINLRLRPVDIAESINEVASSLQPLLEQKGQSLKLEVPGDLPQVTADPDRLAQILTNLLSNAHKYTLEGGAVTVRAAATDGAVRVDVTDTGVGMTSEELDKLFTKFFRAQHPATQKISGTGLGLTITRSLVERQGGRIWVSSEPAKGSTFSFSVPKDGAGKAAQAAPAGTARTEPAPAAGSHTILVVDDEPDIAGLIRRYLEHGGYRVLVAPDASSALETARRDHPDLITLDVNLPDTDGFTLLEWLKADPATTAIPVMMLSVVDDAGRGQLLGAVDYLRKPVDERALLRHVGSIVRSQEPQVVLLADDEADIRSLIAGHLRRAGHQVLEAADGVEAVELARAEPRPGLALLDIRMPRLDGVGALRALRGEEATRSMPVVMMTASPGVSATDRSAIDRLGATILLHKPSSAEELAELIGQGLKGQGLKKESA
jgi:PAS domain S-box-containing protein